MLLTISIDRLLASGCFLCTLEVLFDKGVAFGDYQWPRQIMKNKGFHTMSSKITLDSLTLKS